mmetsp:Transcript_2290/g.3645  ORF Transcript_2290/g.3645 Transcript_2290/m.3645 type:complete len:318 (+) Transcript_2290:487-1440(+)|eukprot:CAMPEP_0196804260 /NCGR_PEP_ID=MMETSP1362-20130617/3835_1 /TAXON_ID=163516 /ORGANISM="Leptocylindrus danicus, Strain CCMP1856" /LENGTH=317 /DNA_ID=CAMNT_0042176427 /DNA_START=488 /DNA_END=1441 /DNA_ORIENTATION=+
MKLSILSLFAAFSTAAALIDDFVPVEEAYEYMNMALLAYNSTTDIESRGPQYTVHFNENLKRETNAFVITNSDMGYIMAALAGTDGINDWISDAQINQTEFGPASDPINSDVGVHTGFNKVLWKGEKEITGGYLYDRMNEKIKEQIDAHPDYKIVVTGHSMGSGCSDLMSVALALDWPRKTILNYSIAPAPTGDTAWMEWVNGFKNLAVWHHINLDDILPRMAEKGGKLGIDYQMVGHTIQYYPEGTKAYYWHNGYLRKGYGGVPKSWNLPPWSVEDHLSLGYTAMIDAMIEDPETYYVDSFETIVASKDNLEVPEL